MKLQAQLRVGLALAAAVGAIFLSGSGARAAGDPKREASFPLGSSKSGPARYVDANGQLIGYHLDSGVAVRFVGDDNDPISIPLTRAGIAPGVAYFLYESTDCTGPAYVEVDNSSIVRPAFYDYLPGSTTLRYAPRTGTLRVLLSRHLAPEGYSCQSINEPLTVAPWLEATIPAFIAPLKLAR